jgi:hypothetical protein
MSPAKPCSLPHAIHSSRAVVVGNGTYLGLKDLTFEIVEKLTIYTFKKGSKHSGHLHYGTDNN